VLIASRQPEPVGVFVSAGDLVQVVMRQHPNLCDNNCRRNETCLAVRGHLFRKADEYLHSIPALKDADRRFKPDALYLISPRMAS
jgi:hypothetical protein